MWCVNVCRVADGSGKSSSGVYGVGKYVRECAGDAEHSEEVSDVVTSVAVIA